MSLLLNLAARILPGFAEWYAVHIYPIWVRPLGGLCSPRPLSVIEVLLYLAGLGILAGIAAVLAKKLSHRRALWILARWTLLAFALFTLNCGIN